MPIYLRNAWGCSVELDILLLQIFKYNKNYNFA